MASDNGNSDDEMPAGEVGGNGHGQTGRQTPVVEDRMSITATGRLHRVVRGLISWKALLVFGLTALGGGGAWAVRAYLDRHDAKAHAPLDAKIEAVRADVITIKVDVAEIKGMVRGALLARPVYGPPPSPRATNP